MLTLLIQLVIIGLIFYAVWWFIGYAGVPEPFNKILRVVVGLVALVAVITILMSLGGLTMPASLTK